jgi:peptidoglycan/LPS O-acetylase OafA/YrhL
MAFAAHLVAADKLLRGVRFNSTGLESAIRWLGSTTFPMYATHYPILCLVAALSPFSRPSWTGIIFVSSVVLAIVALFTPVCERLKRALRLAISRIAYFNRCVPPCDAT